MDNNNNNNKISQSEHELHLITQIFSNFRFEGKRGADHLYVTEFKMISLSCHNTAPYATGFEEATDGRR